MVGPHYSGTDNSYAHFFPSCSLYQSTVCLMPSSKHVAGRKPIIFLASVASPRCLCTSPGRGSVCTTGFSHPSSPHIILTRVFTDVSTPLATFMVRPLVFSDL